MLNVLYVFQFIISILLVFFIFLQKREDATSLLSNNSYNSMFKNNIVVANPFIKLTLIFGILFFLNSVLIGTLLLKGKGNAYSSVIEKAASINNKVVEKKANNVSNKQSHHEKKPSSATSKKDLPVVPLGNTN